MKKLFLQLSLAVLLLGFPTTQAQNGTVGSPYSVGESLRYEGKFRPFLIPFTIADFNFSVGRQSDSDNIEINTKGTSRGTLVKLFNFKFFQSIDSTVDPQKLHVLRTAKRDEQGKRIRESEAKFDYDGKKVTYVETDPNDPARPPRRVASAIEENTQDIVTGVYMLRRMPLAVGKKFSIKLSDSGLVYDVPVTITAREQQKSILGKVWCWKAEPEIFGKGRFIEQKGSLKIWITDDQRRIPVRAKLGTKYGPVEIKLKKLNFPESTPEN